MSRLCYYLSESTRGMNTKTMYYSPYIYIYIYGELRHKDIRQLETSLDAKERHWIWKLETLTPKGLNVADIFHSQNRSSRKKRFRFFTLV